jgi:hypothetical protein
VKITATDPSLAATLGGDVILGKAFAFMRRGAFDKPALGWVQRLLGGSGAARPQVVSLLDREPVALPGATVAPVVIPALYLAAVTSDKALYREGRDEVHLLALDPLAPGAEAALEITLDGADFGRRPARLDARGAAAIALRDLPAGEYAIRFRGAPRETPACSFTVAAYRLAPLVASLVDRRLEGARLAVTLRIESFGSPVDGKVQLELADRGTRIAAVTAEARGGLSEASFTLSGEGPHAINVQLVSDPSRTATVPIVGSRAAERSQTTLSTLGYEITGSLLPSEGSTEVRGVWLSEGAVRTAPFRLDRVDTRRARLTAATAVEAARIVVLDPTYPARRPGAVDPDKAPHPAREDERYRRGEALFHEGKFAESRAAFEGAIAALGAPHPNYAYYVACCFAKEGGLDRAVGALREAIRDGWNDWKHLAADDDLAALRGFAPYEAIKAGGRREIALEAVPAGKSIEIDTPEPMAILAIGAFVGDDPWEGWGATIAPAAIAPALSVPERATPGGEARITIDTGRPRDDASVYLVVKDARLLTPDTPASRLAGGLKALAEATSKELMVGKPSLTLAQAIPPPPPPPPPMAYPPMGGRPGAMPISGGMPMVVPPAPMAQPAPRAYAPPLAAPMIGAARPMPPPAAAPAPVPYAARPELPGDMPDEAMGPRGAPAPKGGGPYREAAPAAPPSVEEPEVLFAGLVETRGGRGAVSLRLGPDFADYVVSAFVAAGTDWAPAEGRFRAEKELFASLDVPAFVHPDDGAIGRLHLGSRSGARVRVTRDGAPVPLLDGDRPLAAGASIPAGRAELSFLAGPGLYEATVEDGSGAVERASRQVDEPGKLRRQARTVRFLEPGQRVSRDEDPAIVSLRVLPGLDAPFRALVDATSDYGHACCEQTAAKMLGACAMYALAGDDGARRDRAEAIILAGVRRERTMFLRGRGFKMYPESSNEPSEYWGPKAARHLWNLGLLRDLAGPAAPGRALADGVAEGLEMARDATAAHGLAWPPQQISTCEDAYAALRFGDANGAAIAAVRRLTAGEGMVAAPPSPHFGGAVAMRTEAAYGAAALLRAGGAEGRPRALGLANAVVKQLGPSGRLYSTVDSVAAIALMVELGAAKIVGGAGAVELDGKKVSTAEAMAATGEIRSIRAVEGVTAVEVTRMVEEDWGTFGAGLPLAVRLQKGAVTTRRFAALDPVELEVTIESGYKAGDLLWVCLPDALSRVVGGGQVKRFSIDFAGQKTARVSLAATGITVGKDGAPAPARFAVCVRNMFEEERGGNPGTLEVTVQAPAGGGSVMDRVLSGLRGLLGS